MQFDVIVVAGENGGFIDREKIYEVAEFDEKRSVRGFTRPITRIAQRFRDEGTVPPDAVDLLAAVYDSESNNPSMAVGFELHPAVLPLVARIASEIGATTGSATSP